MFKSHQLIKTDFPLTLMELNKQLDTEQFRETVARGEGVTDESFILKFVMSLYKLEIPQPYVLSQTRFSCFQLFYQGFKFRFAFWHVFLIQFSSQGILFFYLIVV